MVFLVATGFGSSADFTTALPSLQGNNFSPGLSLMNAGKHIINNSIGTVKRSPSVIPIDAYFPIKYPIPAPPTIVPKRFAPNMNPLIFPNSSGLKISTANPSTATSCKDAKQLWKNNKNVNNPTFVSISGTSAIIRTVATIPACALRIQGLRLPIGK